MRDLQPEQANFLLQLTLRALNNEHQITKRMIEAVPLASGDYRPDPNSMTALELAWHIASAENTFLDVPSSGAFNFDGNKRPESVRNSSDVAQWYSAKFAENIDRLNRAQPEQLVRVVDFRGIFQLPAVLYLEIGLKHSIHHRGQLSVYLRPMGAKVPSIYGESYDDRQARQAVPATS